MINNNKISVENLNKTFPKYPVTVEDKNWIYGIWYCATSWQKAGMFGQHPSNYLKRLVALFPNCKRWLHAPSGILPHGNINNRLISTVDLVSKAPGCPEFISCVSRLPFPDETFDIIETDPPYAEKYEKVYKTGKYPRYRARDEFWRVLKPSGYLCWLDIRYPAYSRKKWKLIGLIGIITGFERVTRILSIFQKLDFND